MHFKLIEKYVASLDDEFCSGAVDSSAIIVIDIGSTLRQLLSFLLRSFK